MKPLSLPRLLTMAASVALLSLGTVKSQAQNRGNFDPEEFRARMMERYREDLKVKSDDEWKVIEGRITAVMEARRDLAALTPRGRGFGGRGGRGGGPGGPGGPGGDQADRGGRRGGDQGGGGGGRRGPGGPGGFGEPSPQVEALEKAVEAGKADDIKAKLASLRSARKDAEAKLTKAQDNLKQVLSVSQEGQACLMGLIE